MKHKFIIVVPVVGVILLILLNFMFSNVDFYLISIAIGIGLLFLLNTIYLKKRLHEGWGSTSISYPSGYISFIKPNKATEKQRITLRNISNFTATIAFIFLLIALYFSKLAFEI